MKSLFFLIILAFTWYLINANKKELDRLLAAIGKKF